MVTLFNRLPERVDDSRAFVLLEKLSLEKIPLTGCYFIILFEKDYNIQVMFIVQLLNIPPFVL